MRDEDVLKSVLDPTVPMQDDDKRLGPARFVRLVDDEVARARRYDRPLAVTIAAIDGVPSPSEANSTPTDLLDAIADAVQALLRQPDQIAILDRSLLGILMPETTAPQAETVVTRLISTIAGDAVDTGSGQVQHTLSAGIAAVTARRGNGHDLIAVAMNEMRRAQNLGGNRVCLPAPDVVRMTIPRNGLIH